MAKREAHRCWIAAFLLLAGSALHSAAQPSLPAPPSPEDQRRILARVSRESLRYQRELPNLICTQVTRRSLDDTGAGNHWKPQDRIEVEDDYIGRFVNHKLLMIDGHSPRKNYQHLNGFLSESVLHTLGFLPAWIFGAQAKTTFEWRTWSAIDGRPMHVFSVRLPPSESQFLVLAGRESVVAGIDGLIYVDAASSLVQRFEIRMDLPAGSAVDSGSVRIDYGRVDLSGRMYLLPLKAEVKALIAGAYRRNEIDVVRYQRYEVDSTVHFEEPDDADPGSGAPAIEPAPAVRPR
jgi:hypothetical protein